MVRHAFEHREQTMREVGAGELLADFGPVTLRDAGDQGLLRREVAVEVARAHAGLGADVLHGGAVEARAHEAALGRRKDLGAAVGLGLHVGTAHRSQIRGYCNAVNENERSLSIWAGAWPVNRTGCIARGTSVGRAGKRFNVSIARSVQAHGRPRCWAARFGAISSKPSAHDRQPNTPARQEFARRRRAVVR